MMVLFQEEFGALNVDRTFYLVTKVTVFPN